MTDEKDTAEPTGASGGYPPCKQCEACCGEGRIVVGEVLVTREMACDAGCPETVGSHYEYEYGTCGECGGGGFVAVG